MQNSQIKLHRYDYGWYLSINGEAHSIKYRTKVKAMEAVQKLRDGLIRFDKYDVRKIYD